MAQPNHFNAQTPWGESLSNLVGTLFDPAAPAVAQQRSAKVERDRAHAELERAKIEDYKAKRDAAAAKSKQDADAIVSLVGNVFGQGPQYGREVMDFRNKGAFNAPPQLPSASGRPDVDDEGIPQAMESIPAPRGYTPESDTKVTSQLQPILDSLALSGKTNYEQLAKGRVAGQTERVRESIMAPAAGGPIDPLKATQAFFATSGKAPFHDSSGRMDNLVTGTINETGPQAVANVGKTGAEAAKATAQATKANADAGLANAKKGAVGKAAAVKLPPGYRWTDETMTEMVPVTGGPADQKITGALNADTQALTSAETNLDRLERSAKEVMDHPGLKNITGLRGALPNIPGGAGANAEAKLNVLKSQVAFGVLQDMRNNSKTGGALGSVSDAEGKRLEANLAALEKAQSMEQFKSELKKIMEFSTTAKENLRKAYNMKQSAAPKNRRAGDAKTPTAAAAGATNAKGWTLHEDADGNKAYVGPNGEVEEVQ